VSGQLNLHDSKTKQVTRTIREEAVTEATATEDADTTEAATEAEDEAATSKERPLQAAANVDKTGVMDPTASQKRESATTVKKQDIFRDFAQNHGRHVEEEEQRPTEDVRLSGRRPESVRQLKKTSTLYRMLIETLVITCD
jgi:hypothetical protein